MDIRNEINELKMNGTIKLYNRWGFLEVDHQVGKYYRSLFYLAFGLKLQRPSNEEHITIVSPEDNINLANYQSLNGNVLSFDTLPFLFHNSRAIWIDVYSQDIKDFRDKLKLEQQYIPLHFCIGYFNEN